MNIRTSARTLRRHILVDFNNVFYKSIHVAKHVDGVPTPERVIHHFFKMMTSWLREMPADPLKVCFFYDGKPIRRIAMDSEYKAHRVTSDETRDLIVSTRPYLCRIIESLSADVYHLSDAEADDLIATYVMQNIGDIQTIISDDKDFFQLLQHSGVVIYRPCETPGTRFVDEERASEIMGFGEGPNRVQIRPNQVRMFKALCGDTSDNIKGVMRLQKKVAAELSKAKDPQEMFSNQIWMFSESTRKRIEEVKDVVLRNYEMVGFKTDCNLQAAKKPKLSRKDLDAVFADLPKIKFMDLRLFGVATKPVSDVPDFLSGI